MRDEMPRFPRDSPGFSRPDRVGEATALSFVVVLSFAAMEQTLRLFTADAFGTVSHSAPYVAAAVGMVLAEVLAIGLHAPASAKPGSPEPQTT